MVLAATSLKKQVISTERGPRVFQCEYVRGQNVKPGNKDFNGSGRIEVVGTLR